MTRQNFFRSDSDPGSGHSADHHPRLQSSISYLNEVLPPPKKEFIVLDVGARTGLDLDGVVRRINDHDFLMATRCPKGTLTIEDVNSQEKFVFDGLEHFRETVIHAR